MPERALEAATLSDVCCLIIGRGYAVTRVRSRQSGFVSIILAGSVVLSALAALLGQGVTSKVLDLIDGGAWVLNGDNNTVSHINIAKGENDALYDLSNRSPITSIKTINGAVVALHADGTVTVLTRDAGATPLAAPELTTSLELLDGRDIVYAVRAEEGEERPLSSAQLGLAPLGDWVALGGSVSSAIVDDQDRLVAALPETGELVTAGQDTLTRTGVFAPSSEIRLTRAGSQGVLVDFTDGSLTTLGESSYFLELPNVGRVSESQPPITEASDTDPYLAILGPDGVVSVDLEKRRATIVELDAVPKLDRALGVDGDAPSFAVSGHSAFIITESGDAVVVDLEAGKVSQRIDRDYRFSDVAPGEMELSLTT